MRFEEAITFDDVLLKPKFSTIRSRSEVDLSVDLGKGFKFNHPFIPSNMKTVISMDLVKVLFETKGLSILHRFMPIEDQIQFLVKAEGLFGKEIFNYLGASVGVREIDRDYVKKFVETGLKIICIDVAHIDSIQGLEMTRWIATNYPQLLLIAGNIATKEGIYNLHKEGADVVRAGIGGGSICQTRVETGSGVPQLASLIECHERRKELEKEWGRKLSIISDGGHSKSSDCVKALCFADMVMLGGMFARTTEAAGEMIEIKGIKYKKYHGSSTHKDNRIEGVKSLVKWSGTASQLITNLSEGLQSGCSYQNVKNLQDLKKNPSFVRITNAGQKENHAHDIDGLDNGNF